MSLLYDQHYSKKYSTAKLHKLHVQELFLKPKDRKPLKCPQTRMVSYGKVYSHQKEIGLHMLTQKFVQDILFQKRIFNAVFPVPRNISGLQ